MNTTPAEVHTAPIVAHIDPASERAILKTGIVSIDGTDGIDYERAEKIAARAAAIAERHITGAISSKLMTF